MSANNSDGNQQLKNILSSLKNSVRNSNISQLDLLPQKYKVIFKFNGQESSTILNIDKRYHNITVQNKCIKIGYITTTHEFHSYLEKNSDENRCFDPPLNVRKHGNTNLHKHTMTDALQILATKIRLSMPNYKNGPIQIEDVATIDGIRITPFRLLRGYDGIYEKYGYVGIYDEYNNNLLKNFKDELKELKLNNITGIDNILPDFSNKLDVLQNINLDTKVIDFFRTISFEDEKKTYNKRYGATISSVIYEKIKDDMHFNDDNHPLILILNKNSKKWKKMSKALTIISVEKIQSNISGNRTQSKTKNIVRNKSQIGNNTRKNRK
jgi:hypothetical protein